MFTKALSFGRKQHWVSNASLIFLSSLLLGLLGHLSIPLPFTPVPLVLQNQAVLVLGALLGPRKGAAAVALFLVQGAMGWPVFAGGASGFAPFVGPTGGYLIGYLVGAYLVGALLEKRQKTTWNVFWALLAGAGIELICGAFHLSLFVGPVQALLLGVLPFLLGDVLKSLICAKGYRS